VERKDTYTHTHTQTNTHHTHIDRERKFDEVLKFSLTNWSVHIFRLILLIFLIFYGNLNPHSVRVYHFMLKCVKYLPKIFSELLHIEIMDVPDGMDWQHLITASIKTIPATLS